MIYKCKGCNKHPEDLDEYIEMGKIEGMTPEAFVIKEEGSLNKETGLFYCTDCYIQIGCPTGTA